MTTTKHRTITMSGRAPIMIAEDEWPIIASARGDSWPAGGPADGVPCNQAFASLERDRYYLTVRRHENGRTVVYGRCDAYEAGSEDCAGGYLLASADAGQLADTIQQVGEECALPAHIIRDCIADLPAEQV